MSTSAGRTLHKTDGQAARGEDCNSQGSIESLQPCHSPSTVHRQPNPSFHGQSNCPQVIDMSGRSSEAKSWHWVLLDNFTTWSSLIWTHKGLCSQFLTLHKLAARAKLRDQLPAEAHAAEAAASRARVKTLWKALARNRSCTWPNPQNLTGTMHCSKVLNVANVHFYDHFVTMISWGYDLVFRLWWYSIIFFILQPDHHTIIVACRRALCAPPPPRSGCEDWRWNLELCKGLRFWMFWMFWASAKLLKALRIGSSGYHIIFKGLIVCDHHYY